MALIILQWVRRWGDMSEKLSRYLVLEDIRAVFFKFCNGIKMKIRNRFHNDSWVGQSTNLALDYKPLASPHPISVPHSLEQTKQISVLLWYVCTKRGAILTFFYRPPPLLNRTLPPEGAPSTRPSHWNHEVIFPFLEMQLQMNRICVSPPTHSIGPNVEWPESRNWLLLQY